MASLLHHAQIDIPIFEPETAIAWSKEDMRRMASSGAPSMVRYTQLRGLCGLTLARALEVADTTLDAAAEACDAQVVDHTWGLYKLPPGSQPYDDRIPAGYCLAAEVEVISEQPRNIPDTSVELQLRQHVNGYYLGDSQDHYLSDLGSGQFIHGIGRISAQTATWLIDIEPIMM